MHDKTLAKRYAMALAELAADAGLLDRVSQDLNGFLQLIQGSADLQLLLVSPTTSQKTQHELVSTYLQQADCAPITANFLRLLVDKRRMSLYPSMVEAFHNEVNRRIGRITVAVAASHPISDSRREELTQSLTSLTQRTVSLAVREDPSLLGGMVLQIGSLMMDFSVRGRLNRMKAFMKG